MHAFEIIGMEKALRLKIFYFINSQPVRGEYLIWNKPCVYTFHHSTPTCHEITDRLETALRCLELIELEIKEDISWIFIQDFIIHLNTWSRKLTTDDYRVFNYFYQDIVEK